MKTRKFAISFLILLPCLVSAQGSSSSSSQLKIPLNARSAALGEATIADESQFSSWLLNPANLFTNGPLNVALTHSQWIQEIQSEFVGAQIPMSFGTIGFSTSATSIPGIEVREGPGPALGTFSARFTSFQLGIAARPVDILTIGVSAKFLYEKLYSDDATGLGFDVGLLYHTSVKNLQAGISLTNAGSLGQFRTERSSLPTALRGGASYLIEYDDLAFLTSASISSNLRDHENHISGSIEASYRNLAIVRLGYQSGFVSRGLTAGMGVRYEFVQFDYGFIPFTLGLGDGHLFSLGFRF